MYYSLVSRVTKKAEIITEQKWLYNVDVVVTLAAEQLWKRVIHDIFFLVLIVNLLLYFDRDGAWCFWINMLRFLF